MILSRKYALLIASLAVVSVCAAEGRAPRTSRQDLIGAWRLVSIEVDGREVDPFYGNGSRGLLIYDASGWFSVQIEGTGRPNLQVPSARPSKDESESAMRAETAVLDSYYAYYGTWSFDAATSTVTHHAKGALYPSEDEATYPQHVQVAGKRMTFSRSQTIAGHASVQTKQWVRISAR